MEKAVNFEQKELVIDSKTPLYRQLEALLRSMILDEGVYAPGDILPSENQLINQFGVSRTTVRLAIKELEQEGLVRREQGLGTIVCDPKFVHPLFSATSFTDDIITKGGKPGSITLLAAEVIPDKREQGTLRLASKETVIKLERVRLVNDMPVGIHIASLSKKHIRSIDMSALHAENFSLYEFLRKEYNIQFGEVVETLEATLAGQRESQLLGVPRGAAILKIERLVHLANGEPFEFCQMAYRGDRYISVVKMVVES